MKDELIQYHRKELDRYSGPDGQSAALQQYRINQKEFHARAISWLESVELVNRPKPDEVTLAEIVGP